MNKKVSDNKYNEKFGRTICEVHREIFDELHENFQDHKSYEQIANKLQEAYTMAKKMDAKLRQYAFNYDDGWWEKEKQSVIEEKLELRSNRKNKF
jgi:hypothetical protein